MTQEDKKLLLKDLCSRLPYHVKCQMEDGFIINDSPFYDYILSERHIELFRNHKCFYIKPYLRPMSSMTKEDKEELAAVLGVDYIDNKVVDFGEFLCEGSPVNIEDVYGLLDWLNAHHFDYRGLIGRNLAISTEVFNPYKD